VVKLITIYVEGGGNDNNRLTKECRRGFTEFFIKLGIRAKIVACGGRSNAYRRFCIGLKHLKTNENCILLVDSEAPVINNTDVWQHVQSRTGDEWQKPIQATNEHLHFMVECMEAWFMADKEALARYYGKEFNQNALSKHANIEAISKKELENTLNRATRDTSKGKYDKGAHSFDILSTIDANKVVAQSPYAKTLCDTLKKL
jgi:hypothetical protein